MFAIWVSVHVKPDRRDEFLKAIEEDARGSREDEAECLRFDVLVDNNDPNHFFFYEVYKNEGSLDAHRAAPHYQVWAAAVEAGVLAEKIEVIRTSTVFPRDDAWA